MNKRFLLTLTTLILCVFLQMANAQSTLVVQPQSQADSTKVQPSDGAGKAVAPTVSDEAMPDFTFTDHVTGKQMSLHEICRQNRYVLVDFWASWCTPCRKEITNFKVMHQIYKGRGFQIISISADAKEADWLKALEEEKLEWPSDIDGDKGICKLFKVQFYPTVYLLDKDAHVIVSNDDARGQRLRAKLAELFLKP